MYEFKNVHGVGNMKLKKDAVTMLKSQHYLDVDCSCKVLSFCFLIHSRMVAC
jgi:hypothetical protein